MSAADALAERERLIAERAHAQDRRNEMRTESQRLKLEIKALAQRRKAAEVALARTGQSADDPAELADRERTLQAEAVRLNENTKIAAKAANDAAEELKRLHHDRYSEFAEYAESLTEAAHESLVDLRAGYEDAHRKIEAARAEWVRIVRDRSQVISRILSPADKAKGKHRELAISPPPENPLPPAADVFDVAIRPPELEPVEA